MLTLMGAFVLSVAIKADLFRRYRFVENELVGKRSCRKAICYSFFYKRKKGLENSCVCVCFFLKRGSPVPQAETSGII